LGSSSESWFEKLEKIAQDIATGQGCVLYDIEMVGAGKGRVLRLYIDKDDGGVGIEDCSNVSKALNQILDTQDVVPGEEYNLEVSTPGLDRHLKKKWHFEKAIGKKIYVRLPKALGSFGVEEKSIMAMKQIEEVLQAVENNDLVFNIRNISVRVPWEQVEKAKVVFELKTNSKKKK